MLLIVRLVFAFLFSIFYSTHLLAIDVLKPVKTDTPQDTMKTFMTAMNRYHEGVKTDDEQKIRAIDKAIRTLNLDHVTTLLKEETGRKAAIYLKEVIDRVIEIDYSRIPPGENAPSLGEFWRLKDTEITIRKVDIGERRGEYLFSQQTVDQAKTYYEQVKNYDYVIENGGAGFRLSFLERAIPQSLRGEWLGFPKWQIVGLFFAILLGFIFKYLTELILKLVKKVTDLSSFKWDDRLIAAVEKPLAYCVAAGVWFLSLYLLKVEGVALEILTVLVQLIFSFSVILIFYRAADVFSGYISVFSEKTDFSIDSQLVPLLARAIKTFVLIFGVLIALQNVGVNVMSVVAGLGLGGLAFALAAKDTAANLFGSLMIFWDRPFKIGDWINFPGVEGTVEEVGFRSTRVRTFYDSQITVPNATVANASIDNYGRRNYRRVRTTLGVTYSTSAETMEVFLEGIKQIIKANSFTRKDYFHVVFSGYGASSLEVLVYFFLKVPDWSQELVQRQNIFIEIKRLAGELGVEFAFPSQSLYVESLPQADEQAKKQQVTEIPATEKLKAARSFGPGGEQAKTEGLGLFVPPYADK